MAAKAFSLLRAFSATKFYAAAQAGLLSGTAPFSIGALVVPHGVLYKADGSPMTLQWVFGNADLAGAGSFIAQAQTAGFWFTTQGAVAQGSGTLLPDATDLPTAQALANQYKSDVNGNAPVVTGPTPAVWDVPRPNLAMLIVMTVDDTNQNTYVNGQLVATTARDTTTSVNPFRIGLDPAGDAASAADSVSIAGAFYHGAALANAQLTLLQAACMDAKDIVADMRGYGGNTAGVLDYVWSVKQTNFDCRANWASRGAQAPINMVRNGTWFPTGVSNNGFADVYSADFSWARV